MSANGPGNDPKDAVHSVVAETLVIKNKNSRKLKSKDQSVSNFDFNFLDFFFVFSSLRPKTVPKGDELERDKHTKVSITLRLKHPAC